MTARRRCDVGLTPVRLREFYGHLATLPSEPRALLTIAHQKARQGRQRCQANQRCQTKLAKHPDNRVRLGGGEQVPFHICARHMLRRSTPSRCRANSQVKGIRHVFRDFGRTGLLKWTCALRNLHIATYEILQLARWHPLPVWGTNLTGGLSDEVNDRQAYELQQIHNIVFARVSEAVSSMSLKT